MRFRIALGLLVLGVAPAWAEVPRVAASIAPVQSLVASVMGDLGTPALIVSSGASPHGYALKPSEARSLQDAALVVWVGPALETFLVAPLERLSPQAKRLALASLPGVRLLPLRQGGDWEPHEHDHDDHDHGHETGAADHEEHGHDDHDHEAGGIDPHLWLDPTNAQVLVGAVADALADLDPEHAPTYRANAAATKTRLEGLDRALQERLAPVRGRSFLVFHDGYQYLEARYGLSGVGAITLHPETPPGAQRMRQIRARLKTQGIACIFAEPQFSPAMVRTVAEGTPARTSTLDPLGAAHSPGPALYEQTLNDLSRALAECLAP